ncbi:MAG: ATP-dependent DNA helicase [Lachnospiraceae bacterium]|nr:ATP-dependent DNA helicase [Lachnospiraceae bacterium]
MLVGAEVHRRIQRAQGESYRAEVSLKIEVPVAEEGKEPEALLLIEGRADGVITIEDQADSETGTEGEKQPSVIIDEIKGVYREIDEMAGPEQVHLAQAEVYAYIIALERGLEKVGVQMTYLQLEEDANGGPKPIFTDKVRRFYFIYSMEEIKARFFSYVDAYKKWVLFSVRHRALRDASAEGFPFPYEYRPGQKKIIHQVYHTIEDGTRLFVQAPTGIGKTLAMLYPAVRAVSGGAADRIFYLTAKTVTGRAAEEGMEIMRAKGLRFSSICITAKDRVCVLEQRRCDPENCPRAKGHFDRVNEAVYDLITHEENVTREVIERCAEKYAVCPYEFSLDVSYYTDVVICDYNYAFAPHVALQRYFAQGGNLPYILLIDEAHNLADRGRDMYSAALVKEDVLAAKKLFAGQRTILKWLERVNKTMLALKRECDRVTVFSEDTFPNALLYALENLKEAMSRFLDRQPGAMSSQEISDFYFEVSDFIDTYSYLPEGYVSYAAHDEEGHFLVRLFCINPAVRLKETLDAVKSTVFFSATFLPVNYYKELLTGDTEEPAVYVDSPFPREKRRLLIVSDVSSRYTRRGPGEYRRIAEYLLKMAGLRRGNYLAFFPSHRFLQDVGNALTELISDGRKQNVELLMQKRYMSEQDRADFLAEFSDTLRPCSLLGLSVMGGVFSEGIDLTHEQLIGVAVVGTGLPQISPERELIRNYYEEHGEDGFDYAYRFPGFNKVMQAAGRLIRTAEDEGVILLLDERFRYRENLALFPREWSDWQAADFDSVERSISEFWESRE